MPPDHGPSRGVAIRPDGNRRADRDWQSSLASDRARAEWRLQRTKGDGVPPDVVSYINLIDAGA